MADLKASLEVTFRRYSCNPAGVVSGQARQAPISGQAREAHFDAIHGNPAPVAWLISEQAWEVHFDAIYGDRVPLWL